jgi:hypothetical protein
MQVHSDVLQDYRNMTYYDGLKNPKQQHDLAFKTPKYGHAPTIEDNEPSNPDISRLVIEMTGLGSTIDLQA